MIKNIKLRSSLLIDFFMSLVRIANKENTKFLFNDIEFSKKFKFDDSIQKWINKTDKKIPDEYRVLINKFFNSDIRIYKLMFYFIRYNDLNELEDLIKIIENFDGNELLAKLVYLNVLTSKKLNTIKELDALEIVNDKSKIFKFIEKINLPSNRKWEMLEILSDSKRFKSEIISLINWYNETIFKHEIKNFQAKKSKQEKEFQRKLEQYGNEYLQLLVNIDYNNDIVNRNIIINLSYYMDIGYFIFLLDDADEDFYVLGYRHMAMFGERKHSLLSRVMIFKTLGDETRQNIIKLLSKESLYGDEIAQKLKLSNSTVSYHLNMLVIEGFVVMNRVDKRTYFSLNKEKIEKAVMKSLRSMLNIKNK